MINKFTYFLSAAFLILSTSCNLLKQENVPAKKFGMDKVLQQEWEMTHDTKTELIPREKLIAAKEYKDKQLRTRAALSGVKWRELGPNNCAGRSRCVLVDANDTSGNTVWTAGVGGGLWKTTNINAAVPTWTPINDLLDNIAITDIAQDPINKNIMYYCTGEGYGNSDRISGLGVFKSTNGGATWSSLSASQIFVLCFKIEVTAAGTVLLATSSGLQRSTNGGNTFSKVLGTGLGITGTNSNTCYDVDIMPNGDVYANVNGSLHKSTNDGVTFGAALALGVTAERIETAVSGNNSNNLHCVVEVGSAVASFISSTNGGATFTAKNLPTDADPGIGNEVSRGQAWYDLSIGVDPNNDNNVFIGGVDLFKTADGGNTWNQVSHWYGGFGFQDVHADQHDVLFMKGNSDKVFFTNDGGLYYCTNATATIPTILPVEIGMNTTQFYSCAIHPTANTNFFLAGAQDNGSHLISSDITSPSVEVTGGDGGFCHIDQNEPQYVFTSTTYNRFIRSTNGGASFSSVSGGNTGRFINPSDYDNVNNRMYSARGTGEYLVWDNAQTGNTFNTKTVTIASQVSAVYTSPTIANRVYFGFGNGSLLKVDSANTTPIETNISSNLPTGKYLSSIAVETGNENHILVCFSNYNTNSIWETTNGGTSWTSVEGNLPDMPVRSILLNPANADQALIATELGVWSTDNLNGNSTVWGASNTGLANTRVDMLQIRASDKLVLAATHGRGMFYSDIFMDPLAKFNANTQLSYANAPIQFINTSNKSTSYAWNFGDGTTSTVENPIKSYANAGTYNVTLTINNGASTETKNAFIRILPNKTTPFTLAMGGNFESNPNDFASYAVNGTAFQRGNSLVAKKNGTTSGANAWVTGLTGNYVNSTESYLYTPNFDFSINGNYYLSFNTKYSVEDEYDGFLVQYSTDSGSSWANLGNMVQSDWYNYQNNPPVSIVFPFNQAFFSYNTANTFIPKIYDVSTLAGNARVAFRMQFKADEFVTDAGIAIDDFEITGPVLSPLAINVRDFAISKLNAQDIGITWQTATETEIEKYNVERSVDGTNFEIIKNTFPYLGSINKYNEIDINAWKLNNTEKLYYRISSVKKDNTISYSNTLQLSNAMEDIISVGPIPCNKYLIIKNANNIKKIHIIDVQGHTVYKASNLKDNRVNLPENMAAGTYMIEIQTNNGKLTRKFLKQ